MYFNNGYAPNPSMTWAGNPQGQTFSRSPYEPPSFGGTYPTNAPPSNNYLGVSSNSFNGQSDTRPSGVPPAHHSTAQRGPDYGNVPQSNPRPIPSTYSNTMRYNGSSTQPKSTTYVPSYNGSARPDPRASSVRSSSTAATSDQDKLKAFDDAIRGYEKRLSEIEQEKAKLERDLQRTKADRKKLEFQMNHQASTRVAESSPASGYAVSASTNPTMIKISRLNPPASSAPVVLNPAPAQSRNYPPLSVGTSLQTASTIAPKTVPAVSFRPMSLVYESNYEELVKGQSFHSYKAFSTRFSLNSSQITAVATQNSSSYEKRVILRCCIFNQSSALQVDKISNKLSIKVNNNNVYQGNAKKSDMNGPLDITNHCQLDGSLNSLEISFITGAEVGMTSYAVSVVFASKHSTASTLDILTNNPNFKRSPEETKKIIRSKFTQSSDITCDTDSIKMNLICPISKRRFSLPAFGVSCEHLTHFDAKTFIEMHRMKAEWNCPICRKPIGFDELRIDGLLQQILKECGASCRQIEFDATAEWKAVEDASAVPSDPKSATTVDDLTGSPDLITLSSDDDDDSPPPPPPVPRAIEAPPRQAARAALPVRVPVPRSLVVESVRDPSPLDGELIYDQNSGRNSSPTSASSSSQSNDDDDSDQGVTVPMRRGTRTVSKRPVVDDADEDSSTEESQASESSASSSSSESSSEDDSPPAKGKRQPARAAKGPKRSAPASRASSNSKRRR